MANLGDLLRDAGLRASTPSPAVKAPLGPQSSELVPEISTLKRVVLRRTRKGRGGKTVTTVDGVSEGVEQLAKRLRKEMGVGSRVEDGLLVLHGDQLERLARWFESQGVKKVVRG